MKYGQLGCGLDLEKARSDHLCCVEGTMERSGCSGVIAACSENRPSFHPEVHLGEALARIPNLAESACVQYLGTSDQLRCGMNPNRRWTVDIRRRAFVDQRAGSGRQGS